MAFLLPFSACGSPAPLSAVEPAAQQPAQAGKTLTIGILREPDDFASFAGSGVFGGAGNVPRIAHDDLVVQDDTRAFRPLVAAELPSLERGTMQVKPDGSMDVVWKLRPNVQWHDGAPLTSADVLFTVAILKDPETPRTRRGRPDLVRSATVVDPLTVVVHWSAPFANAPQGEALQGLLPAHLLDDVYRRDKAAFLNSPYLSTEFVGVGPYRLARWERGSHMEFARFDAYYQGRPPLERVTVRFLGDPNTLVANILSGAVDVALPFGLDIDNALEVKRRWEGTGNQVRFDVHGQLTHVEIQHRVEMARPTNGLIETTVRRALYLAIDRATLAETLTHGLSPSADSWFPPGDALRAATEPSTPQYPYDPKRAAELLSEAGWVRASNGSLVHGGTGERFETQLWTRDEENVMRAVSDNWQAAGVIVQAQVIPVARAGDSEYGLSYNGALIQSPSASVFYESRLHSNFIASPANRWAAANRSGYNNPRADALMDRLAVALDPAEQLSLHGQLLREMLGDVAIMPLFWPVAPVLQLKGVKSHKVVRNDATWDFFGWDRE